MRKIPHVTVLALGIAGAMAFASNVQAAGFQLKENSVKSMGSAFAGTAAKTGDSSVVVNNPAVMTQFEGNTFQADLTAIDLNYEFEGTATDALGRPMTGSNGGNAGAVTPVPAMSYIRKLDNGAAVGAMISAPFGLKTEYEDNWVGRYFAHTSDMRIVDLTMSGAIDITDRFSVGIGAIVSRADVTLSKSVDFGAALGAPQAADGFVEIQGDDNSFGWLVGAHFRPTDSVAFGVSYRSEIDYELNGTAQWDVPGNVRGALDGNPLTQPLYRTGPGGAALTTPSVLTIGANWQVNDRLALSATFAETGWSSLQEVRVQFDNPDPDAVEPFEWSDSTFASIGAEYKLNDSWTLRGGIADDQTPTSLVHRTPRLPDDDRRWYSIGATWAFSDALDVNFAFTHIKPDDPKIDATVANNGARIVGPFDGSANLFGVSAQYRF
ncbi:MULTISPECIES: OmpP1/FadL family transporter [unclassified Luteimonas]